MLRISDELLHRYDVPVPRYTSYPPATAFVEGQQEEIEEIYTRTREEKSDVPLSLYVHLPFCKSMCRFCGCAVIVSKDGHRWDPYLDWLFREIDMVRERLGERTIHQLHWGGGTPNWLPHPHAERLFKRLTEAFPLADDAEVAIECDPETLREGQLGQLRALGFNRLSMGVQDMDPKVQYGVGRIFHQSKMEALYEYARSLEFESINLDLMYGLPYQTLESFQKTVETIAKWHPNRIAIFGYAHVPWMKPHQRLMDEDALPDGRLRLDLFSKAVDVLMNRGYAHLGLDHFVQVEDSLAVAKKDGNLTRNFQGYSIQRSRDLLQLGLTAIGDLGGAYLSNHRKLKDYQAKIESGLIPVERVLRRTPKDELVRQGITEVMCNDAVNLENLVEPGQDPQEIFGVHVIERLDALAVDGILERSGWQIKVTELGRFFLRHVATAIDPAFKSSKGDGPRFSRAI